MFFPVVGDPYYSSVSLLLPMTGANGSTTFTDVSPTPKTVTRNNAITSTTQSKWGNGSGYFDGTGDYLTVPNTTSFRFGVDDYTVECWVYQTSRPGSGAIYDQSIYGTLSGTGYLLFFLNSSTGHPAAWNGTSGVYSTIAVTLNAWSHVAWCRINGTLKIFVDGVQGASATHNLDNSNSTETIKIGGNGGGGNDRFFYGYIQDLRITKGVARYTANFTPPNGPLPPRTLELPAHRRVVRQPSHHAIARLGL